MALTPKQKAFAEALGRGHLQKDAARLAGYATTSENALAVTASRLSQNPAVQAEAWRTREAKLQGSLAQKAMACLESILDDQTAPAPARVSAAKFVMESAGHGIESRKLALKAEDTMRRGLADMTNAELIEFIRSGEASQQGAAAQTIDVVAADAEGEHPDEDS